MTEPRLTLTYAQAKADLLEIAESAPERTIKDMGGYCVYFAINAPDRGDLQPGEGCCIVGRLLEKHGVTIDDLNAPGPGDLGEPPVVNLNEGVTVKQLTEYDVLALDAEAMTLLEEAQALQDSGWAWGDAVKEAIRVAEGIVRRQ